MAIPNLSAASDSYASIWRIGYIQWNNCFSQVPSKTVEKIVFGRQEISEQMMFNPDGTFRFIEPAQDLERPEESSVHAEKQARFFEGLLELFRTKFESDPSYISNFVNFCTGSSYIPDLDLHNTENNKWAIRLEYNCSLTDERLPSVFTCENTMLLPATAYDGNIETFEKKLKISMNHTMFKFDMH